MKHYFFALLTVPLFVSGLIEEDVMPGMLQDCYSSQYKSTSSEYEIQTNCLQNFLSYLYRNNSLPGLEQTSLEWIDSLGRRLHRRLKRQAGKGYRGRTRREIRTLSERERENLFAAINALKRDTSMPPNKYDALALLHQGAALDAAHDGPAFVSWHRYYLILYEEALRTKKRNVVLPYWDSRCDHRMTNPEQTILLSELFWGNGQGPVFTGPFAFWRTPAQNTLLRRDVPGPRSSLIDPQKIKNVLNKKYHRQILTPTSSRDLDNLERHHDGIHRWVGGRDGHLAGLATAPQEPIFWFLHCFVDYLWEEFRQAQQRKGVNSDTDYPATSITGQQPNDNMARLKPPKTNIEGYKNSFIRNIYRYAPAPTCTNSCGRAKKAYLYCDQSKRACVSRSRSQFEGFSNKANLKYWNKHSGTKAPAPQSMVLTPLSTGTTMSLSPQSNQALTASPQPQMSNRFRASIIDSRTSRRRRSIDFPENINSLTRNDINLILYKSNSDKTWSSDFIHATPDNWVVTPVEIINNHDSKSPRLISVDMQTSLDPFAIHSLRKPSTGTRHSLSFNITLQADGFSYNGRYTDYIIVDERSRFSESVSFIAFRKPVTMESKAYVRVYDSYGGLCKPNCLTSHNTYNECSGVVKLTSDYPLMYVDLKDFKTGADMKPFFRFICQN